MATLTGKTLGRYQVGERIGRGGMAEVYQGLHPRLGRQVAIKVLHSHLMEGEDFLARFEREARAVAALRHPRIVQVYDFDVEDEIAYMVMEFIDGISLKSRLQEFNTRNKHLPLKDVVRIMDDIGAALSYAHQQDMIHRDVKPSNVLLSWDGDAYLTDFGIVRILSETQFTSTGTLIGTPDYMSPEQGRGETLTYASDIYSLGVILFEIIVGTPPYEADTPLGTIHKHINDPLPSPRELRPDLPEAVEAVVQKALAKQPADRFRSASALAASLDKALAAMVETTKPSPEAASLAGEDAVLPDEDQPDELAATVVMPETPDEEILATTVVMEGQSDEAQPDVETPSPVMPVESSVGEVEGGAPPVVQSEPERSTTTKRRWLPLALGGLFIAAAVVVLVLTGVFRPSGEVADCPNVDECLAHAYEAFDAGDPDSAIKFFERAAGMVPEDARWERAQMHCELGHAFLALDQANHAIESFETCLAWAGDEPDAENARLQAQEMLAVISAENGECFSVDNCLAQAAEFYDAGEMEAAVNRFESASELAREAPIPLDERPEYAQFICTRGHAYLELDMVDEAMRSFEICIDWAGDAPENEPLVREAEGMLEALMSE